MLMERYLLKGILFLNILLEKNILSLGDITIEIDALYCCRKNPRLSYRNSFQKVLVEF